VSAVIDAHLPLLASQVKPGWQSPVLVQLAPHTPEVQ
jgi:hypothetical protein